MIGAAAAVLFDPAPELAEGEGEHAAFVTVRRQIVVEGPDRVGKLHQQLVLRHLLIDVRIERTVFDVDHFGAEIAADDLGG